MAMSWRRKDAPLGSTAGAKADRVYLAARGEQIELQPRAGWDRRTTLSRPGESHGKPASAGEKQFAAIADSLGQLLPEIESLVQRSAEAAALEPKGFRIEVEAEIGAAGERGSVVRAGEEIAVHLAPRFDGKLGLGG